MSLPILGVDIAKDSFVVHFQHQCKHANRTFHNRRADFPQLTAWLAKHHVTQAQVCMEATGRYWEELAYYLHQAGHTVCVVNPARIHDYARSKLARNKTDKLDAALIADFCATQAPTPWTPPAPEVRELQAMVHHLEALQEMRVQEHNRLTSDIPSSEVRQALVAHLAFLDQQIREMKAKIQEHLTQHPDLKRQRELLVSIPGIAELTAAKLLAENIQSFSDARALTAYAGLSPQQGESGTSVRHKSVLCKVGNHNLRKALYFPAITAMRFNPIVSAFCARLEARQKHPMVIVGAAMHKLLVLALGVLKSGMPFDPNYTAKAAIAI